MEVFEFLSCKGKMRVILLFLMFFEISYSQHMSTSFIRRLMIFHPIGFIWNSNVLEVVLWSKCTSLIFQLILNFSVQI